MKQAGVGSDMLEIHDDVWKNITRPLGFDGGMRTLERTIEGVVRKVALQVVEGKIKEKMIITPENVKQFLPH
jgi:ATP-dependent Lon protease